MYMLCEYSVRNKTQSHCKWYKPSLCVCVSVCVCVCMHVCVHMCVHSCTCMLCKDSVRNKNPKSLQAVQAQSVCVHVPVCVHMCVCLCVCMCVCVCVCVCDEYGVRAINITMQVCACTCTCFVNTV